MKKSMIWVAALASTVWFATDGVAQRGGQGGQGGQGGERRRGGDPAAMIERLDANKDGKLTKNEVDNERLWKRLSAADKDNDGSITLDELKAAQGARGARRGRGAGAGDGKGEGDGPGARGRGGQRGDPMARFDTNKDGVLTKEEVNNDRAWQRLSQLDKNKDGKITADELPARGRGRGDGAGEGKGNGRTGGDVKGKTGGDVKGKTEGEGKTGGDVKKTGDVRKSGV